MTATDVTRFDAKLQMNLSLVVVELVLTSLKHYVPRLTPNLTSNQRVRVRVQVQVWGPRGGGSGSIFFFAQGGLGFGFGFGFRFVFFFFGGGVRARIQPGFLMALKDS